MSPAGPDRRRAVALETTLIVHGVPREAGRELARVLADIVRAEGATPALVGVVRGEPVVGMTDDQLDAMLAEPHVEKANSSNLGVLMHRRAFGATTVSATMQLAADAGVRLFATGGVGGVHRGYAHRLDISADLGALARFPVAVVSSGVKSILDVVSTREALETLGVPVVGFKTDRFPAFYLRQSDAGVDARFDDEADLAAFIHAELERTGRGVLIANPIPKADELPESDWRRWLNEAESRIKDDPPTGRDVTPRLLAHLHELSGGATLRANLALVKSNTHLAARLAR